MSPRAAPPRAPRRRGAIVELVGPDRDQVLPILKESFTGYYRWHAKRQLREVPVVRAFRVGTEWWGAIALDRLAPEVGYVYYVFTGRRHRRRGVARSLVDDALRGFRRERVAIVYAVVRATNRASLGLFRSRGFVPVAPDEKNWRDGGLGAWGLRSRMRIIAGERLLARRVAGAVGRAASAPPRSIAGARSALPRRRQGRPPGAGR